MKYFLIAGEASGDIHAAQLIAALKTQDSNAQFRFLGGDLMAQAAGVNPIIHYKDMAFMGFVEVIKHLKQILSFLKIAKNSISQWHPDAVILIDYPSFNLKIAKFTKSIDIPTFYYISPKVWAWKEYRVKQIKQFITEMYSILPFETEFYARHNYHVEYVGNPTVTEIANAKLKFDSEEAFKLKHSLNTEKPIIALLPGSRKKELRNNLPEMIKAASKFTNFQTVIGGAPGIDADYYHEVLAQAELTEKPKVIFNNSFELVAHARTALVTSGTATLETAIIGTPQVVCYRMNGSKTTYKFYRWLLKGKYVSLPNLIANDDIVEELLLNNCNAQRISKELRELLADSPQRQKMLNGYKLIANRLTTLNSAETTASKIIAKLKQ